MAAEGQQPRARLRALSRWSRADLVRQVATEVVIATGQIRIRSTRIRYATHPGSPPLH
jgi:hypothetical protein